jgi:hypothetical protein
MTVTELATCRFPVDLASPAPVGGYIMVSTMFYERGFGVPSHRFLCLLLQFYGLELHLLSPSGILQIAGFMTLCEAYIRIEPTLICGTISSAFGYGRAQMQKQQCGAVWTSLCDPGRELAHISFL